MHRHVKTLFAGAIPLLVGLSGPWASASASADDQARLDGVIDAFEQRMTDAGWVGTPSDDESDSADDDDDDSTLGDDEFAECLGELATLVENVDAEEFPGQTAVRESLEFTYAPEGVAPETTEEFSFEIDDEETAAAFAVSVDDANVELLDSFVDIIGAKETGDCMRDAMEAEMAADPESEDLLGEFAFDIENEADLDVGDRSARLEFHLSASVMGIAFEFDVNMYLARVGNDLVMVMHGASGEIANPSGFDPLVELQTLVDSLG